MHAIKKRRISELNFQIIVNKENEEISIFDLIENKSLDDQLKYYKNKLVFLELPEIREVYSKDYLQQQKRETTEKFRELLRQKN
jgi:hypothetical protein